MSRYYDNINNAQRIYDKYKSICLVGQCDIYKAYKCPSQAKRVAYEHISNRVSKENGDKLTVISANCQTFYTGYMVGDMFVYDTPYNTYRFKICDNEVIYRIKKKKKK